MIAAILLGLAKGGIAGIAMSVVVPCVRTATDVIRNEGIR